MRKKLAAFWVTLVLCLLAAMSAFAAKPALQAYLTFDMNSVGGVSPTIYYRNNTGKTLKYIDWYMTPYNAVNDKVRSEIIHYTYGEVTGPVAPFSTSLEKDRYTAAYAVMNGQLYDISTDAAGCPYLYQNGIRTYLTNSEVDQLVLDQEAYFECMWYNWSIDHIVITKAVITYMDGSTQTVSGSSMMMINSGAALQNEPYETLKSRYADVYDYTQYKAYNPDLVSVFGDDEHRYLEHFLSNGMKEGRRGKYEFDLASYKANNPDLVAVFGADNVKYYEHYISCGKSEGRSALSTVPEFEITNWEMVWSKTPGAYGYGDINLEMDYRNNTGRTIDKVEIVLRKGNSYYYNSTLQLTGPVAPQTAGHCTFEKTFYTAAGDTVEITSVKVTYTDGLVETLEPSRAVQGETKKTIVR